MDYRNIILTVQVKFRAYSTYHFEKITKHILRDILDDLSLFSVFLHF